MTPQEIVLKLRQQPFEPFEIITSSGERYPVRHRELAHITRNGAVYVFQPGPEGDIVESPNVVSMLHVASIEPLRQKSA